ncbi:MAG: cobalamin biosynthesis protein [Pseudomonadales bacterium]|uniref:Cobalamin biosynthesis protein CbiG n=1 Tax=Oleiphilus messinensis TaxID=141451 RepID=A0A1Y0I8J5_9GAMM|nr:cobalamin biosynthesis protein [Oleiphilus messinensis]ARU56808.1 cobalamin biosynthesis protein CbiG [Oleiphilus messinensis]MCG8610777.1 cobalamin biosynthesis protein [Pseudomonadales bacterium]
MTARLLKPQGGSVSNRCTIVSLTAKGLALAKRLEGGLASDYAITQLHKPKPFALSVQAAFNSGSPLILICAAGIAVRTLAPVLVNKSVDPPVLLLDERGCFVIPFLSGHEGGANNWGREIANQIGATLVLTTAADYLRPVYVAGMGCERSCPQSVLMGLLEETLALEGLEMNQLSAIASIDIKSDEVGLYTLAEALSLPFLTYPATALRKVEHLLSMKSEIVFREVGCYGVAEAAALIGAKCISTLVPDGLEPGRLGTAPNIEQSSLPLNHIDFNQDTELVVNKQKNKQATCAIARSYCSGNENE